MSNKCVFCTIAIQADTTWTQKPTNNDDDDDVDDDENEELHAATKTSKTIKKNLTNSFSMSECFQKR